MQLLSVVSSGRIGSSVRKYAGVSAAITLTICALSACGQAPVSDAKPSVSHPKPDMLETLYLTYGTQQRDLNDVQTAMRNMLPNARIYGVPSQQAIVLWATQDDLALAHRILADLDKRRPTYRLTYTVTELDGGKRVSEEHFVLVAVGGDRTEFKQGSRVPILTGSVDSDTGKPNTQVQYVDVGLKIDATLDVSGESLTLRTKLEQSGVAEEKSNVGIQDPVIRQSTLEGDSTLAPGKALVLGAIDVPGTARREEFEVVAEAIR